MKREITNPFMNIEEEIGSVPIHLDIYHKKSMDILDRIHLLMQEKNINQKELAEILGKKESEVSKWINGVQNFTIKTISKLEAALETEILVVKKPEMKFSAFEARFGVIFPGSICKHLEACATPVNHFTPAGTSTTVLLPSHASAI